MRWPPRVATLDHAGTARSTASTWWATVRWVHPSALRAQAAAELEAMSALDVARCQAGAHVPGPSCHQHPQPHHHLDGLDVAGELAALAALPRYRSGLVAIPFEVWAARA